MIAYPNFIKLNKYDIPYKTWIALGLIQSYFFVLAIPYFIQKIYFNISSSYRHLK